MRHIHFILVVLIGIMGIVAFVWAAPVSDGATGLPHAAIAGMKVGGDAPGRLAVLGEAPYLLQLLVIAFIALLFDFSIPPHRRRNAIRWGFLALSLFAAAIWTAVWFGYRTGVSEGGSLMILGFPWPSTLAMWGIWGSMLAFDLFYVWGFRRFILHPDDEAAFEALVAEMKADAAKGGEGA